MMGYNVQPLRTEQEIKEFKRLLAKTRYGQRNQFLFILGINTGLRMSDLVQLRVKDVAGRDITYIKEQKTGKTRSLFIKQIQPFIQDYLHLSPLSPDEFLFKRQGSNEHLTVNYVYKLFNKVAEEMGRDDIGTHTLRKTFGYHYYKKTKDIGALMVIFKHSNESITKRYIGITDDEISNSLLNFKIGY
jgi:integrase